MKHLNFFCFHSKNTSLRNQRKTVFLKNKLQKSKDIYRKTYTINNIEDELPEKISAGKKIEIFISMLCKYIKNYQATLKRNGMKQRQKHKLKESQVNKKEREKCTELKPHWTQKRQTQHSTKPESVK